MRALLIRPGLEIPARCLEWSSARSSGPGGQNVNKVETKVALKFDFEQCELLSAAVKARLRARFARRLDASGRLVVTCQVARDRGRNQKYAEARLGAIVREALRAPKARMPTRPTRASRECRLTEKKRVSAKKQARGRVGDE
ncbi:MAG: aminoacyl-tRNA hydrolase [Polyangiaceae bacterium]|nr:aminoacyl-tRNA hydrolase [Polyangiaceae bacterium]